MDNALSTYPTTISLRIIELLYFSLKFLKLFDLTVSLDVLLASAAGVSRLVCSFDWSLLKYDSSFWLFWSVFPKLKALSTCYCLEFPAHKGIFHPSLNHCHSTGCLRPSLSPHGPHKDFLGSFTSYAKCGRLKCSGVLFPPPAFSNAITSVLSSSWCQVVGWDSSKGL